MTLEPDFRLGDWIVKPLTNSVVGPAGEAHVEPKAMQVLSFLAGRPGQVVTKQEILGDVWEGTFVSEEVLPNAIWELRKALGDDAKRPRFIQTLPKKGYRLIARVETPTSSSNAPAAPQGRRTRMWRWLPAAAFAGLVAAGFLLAQSRRGGAPATAGRSERSVLVMGFENHTRSPDLAWLTTGVPTMLRTGLAEVAGVRVVSDQAVSPDDSIVNRRDAARSAGASAVVVGSIFKNGAEYRIDVQVEDVEEARILAARSARGEDVFRLMDELTHWVRDTVSPVSIEPTPAPTSIPPLREMTTTSLEAFRLYNEGLQARRHLRLGDARRLLTEAVALDPGFALAYLELQEIARGQGDEAGYQSLRTETLEHQERLPPQKRMMLEAVEIWKKDPARADQILRDVIERSPDEEDAYLQLAHLYRSSYQVDESLAILERGVVAAPQSGYLRLYYGYGLLWQGRYPEALHQFEVYSRINPEEANPWDSMGEAYLIAGIPDRALEKYARSLEIDPKFSSSHLGRAWAFGQLGEFRSAKSELDAIGTNLPPHMTADQLSFFRAYLMSRAGRYREAEAILERLTEESKAPSASALRTAICQMRALLEIERGRPTSIPPNPPIEQSSKGPQGSRSRQLAALSMLLGGVAASRSGDLSRAKEYLAELGELHDARDPREKWWYHLLLGELALASGDPRAAYASFTQGEPRNKLMFNVTKPLEDLGGSLIFRDGAARAKALEGDRRAAIEVYRELLRPDIGHKWTAVLEPRFHLELARLERQEGEVAQAMKHYRDFLELWSDADPDLPEIAQARGYLASTS
jgi:DNA-binding winged helix-turn-helix (wHTH) protein/tetratricopeptide (TPR) repeat protein/TolB-like protein